MCARWETPFPWELEGRWRDLGSGEAGPSKDHPGTVRPIVVSDLGVPARSHHAAAPMAPPRLASSGPDATRTPESPSSGIEAATGSPQAGRRVFGVLLRARARGGVYDIVAYQDAILLSRATGTDPALIGALIGLVLVPVVGAIAGALIGERIARTGATNRVQELFYAPPEYVFGRDRRNRFIRAAHVTRARLWEYGARQRVLELELRDGSTRRLQFDARFQSNSFAPETLRIALGPSLEIERRRFRPLSAAVGAVVGLVGIAIVTMVVVAVLSA